jgi:hypothetical protein
MHALGSARPWVLTVLLAGGACGGDAAPAPAAPAVPTSLVVSPSQATVEMGGGQTFSARVLDQAGQPVAATVTWTSADPALATVSAAGLAVGVVPGTVALTARYLTLSGTGSLTVHDGVAPTVAILTPTAGARVSGQVALSVSAADNHRVGQLTLLVDGVTAGTLTPNATSGTYAFTWNADGAAVGAHTVAVQATDPSGNQASASVSVTVDAPVAASCSIYPADNPWNTDISAFPVNVDSDKYIARLANTWRLAFAASLPVNVIHRVRDNIPLVPITYTAAGDPGPMPIPFDAVFQVKDSSRLVLEDNHLVVMDSADCRLYELWSVTGPNADSSWTAATGSVFDLTSNALRPDHAPSSSASGLPVFVGIAREDEVRAGAINHALSIPATLTQEGFIRPATEWQPDAVYERKLPLVCATATFPFKTFCDQVNAGTFPLSDPFNAPMGLRLRLKAGYDLSGFTGEALVILMALKKYGIFVTDGSGTAGMLRGEQVADPLAWDWPSNLSFLLSAVPATAFEVVETGPILR